MAYPRTLVELFSSALGGPDRELLAQRNAAGDWTMLHAHALRERIIATSYGLHAAGVAPGDRVALMAPNSIDWIVAHLAILNAGAVAVPLYAAQAHDQVRHILQDSEARLLFVDTPQLRDALRAASIVLPQTVVINSSDADGLATLETRGRTAAQAEPGALEGLANAIGPDDLAVLIYTSGTTGTPKGVMLTHRNIVSNVIDAFALLTGTIRSGDAVLSVLPYAHIYESTNLYGYLHSGLVVYVNTRLEALLDDFRTVQPVLFCGVPRIYERVLAGIVAQAKTQGGVAAKLVPWALEVGRDYTRARAGGRIPLQLRLQHVLAQRAVLGRIKMRLGLQNVRCCGSGSAALHADTAFTFSGFGVPIVEGYGLTECSPVVAVNSPRNPAIGTVGKPIANVEIKLAADGELLVRGPGVMKGYYHDPVATERAIEDGWLHTGDVATIGPDGNVQIIDRKNELFKTSGGKYVAPARIESALLRSIYFNQVMVLGAGRAHPVALISPHWKNVRAELHVSAEPPDAELATRDDVRRLLEAQARLHTADLAPFEHIRSIGILPRDLSIAADELSPTLKIKRRIVEARYAGLVGLAIAVYA